jgi:hypothetical protein
MKASKSILMASALFLGLMVGALAGAMRDGRFSVSGLFARGDARCVLSATPVCNPNDVASIDLDGELPGGG